MTPSIRILEEKKLIGNSIKMSLTDNRTFELWKSFMPRKKDIQNILGADLYSMRVYDEGYSFETINVSSLFEKWAAVEVPDFSALPDGMEKFILKGGLYAIFNYKGLSNDPEIFQYIYKSWLPNSVYTLDNRPHFEILGAKYRNNDPESEEEIWIPLKEKIISPMPL